MSKSKESELLIILEEAKGISDIDFELATQLLDSPNVKYLNACMYPKQNQLVVPPPVGELIEKVRSGEVHIIPRKPRPVRYRRGWNPLKALFPIYPVPHPSREG